MGDIILFEIHGVRGGSILFEIHEGPVGSNFVLN
jgi:hypothetical protein